MQLVVIHTFSRTRESWVVVIGTTKVFEIQFHEQMQGEVANHFLLKEREMSNWLEALECQGSTFDTARVLH